MSIWIFDDDSSRTLPVNVMCQDNLIRTDVEWHIGGELGPVQSLMAYLDINKTNSKSKSNRMVRDNISETGRP